MRTNLLCILCFLFPVLSGAQLIPGERLVDWSGVGLQYSVSNTERIINLVERGADPQGEQAVDDLMDDILSETEGERIEIYFPPGRYLFKRPLTLPSHVTLRGAGADSSVLLMRLETENSSIRCVGHRESKHYYLAERGERGDTMLHFSDASLPVEVGDYLYLWDSDDDLVTSTWAAHSTGQLIRIKGVMDSTLLIDEPLRRTYRLNEEARAAIVRPVTDIRIEQLKIRRIDREDQQTSNILFRYAANCSVDCIESDRCHFAHITLSYSTHIEVRGSYLHNAFDFGGGGRGYGLVLQYATGSSLVHDNVFDSLRHAMLMQAGSNGNVLSYNYSRRPYWTSIPSDAAGDLVLHGNYPYANLWEGNVVQNIVIDASHGINGPFNTVFRNRAEKYGIVMSPSMPSDSQNFIGNELTGDGLFQGNYVLYGDGHFAHGNNQGGTIRPPGTKQLSLNSLYLDSIPVWYLMHAQWPPVGYPASLGQYMNRAQWRIQQGYYTRCSEEEFTAVDRPLDMHALRVYPNPADQQIHLEMSRELHSPTPLLRIFNSVGKVFYEGDWRSVLSVEDWPSGPYFIQLRTHESVYFSGRLVVL